MRNLKWLYACSLAIAFGVLSFVTVSCHDDDDEPKQEPGELPLRLLSITLWVL